MALLKLNRINKGGEILLNDSHIMSIEIETRSTTVRLTDGQIFSVEESPDAIAQMVEHIHSERIKSGILSSGLGVKPLSDAHPPALPPSKP
ncbi:MAG TPA: flagellar FlbD family protein [Verrucomicrobiota bacterium]|nr:flagellar FlbD family protein [Verrucomicrobiota bacterium]